MSRKEEKSSTKLLKRKLREKENNDDLQKNDHTSSENGDAKSMRNSMSRKGEKSSTKLLKRKLREKENNGDSQKIDHTSSENGDAKSMRKDKLDKEDREKRRHKLILKKKKKEIEDHFDTVDVLRNSDEDNSDKLSSGRMLGNCKISNQSEAQNKTGGSAGSSKTLVGTGTTIDKSKKAGKGKKHRLSLKKKRKEKENKSKVVEDEIYHISSGDDDCSKGMKKWLTEYHQSRQRLEILQGKIDDFITVHEAQKEQERKEREARAAEGGFTVVEHHKGRKKTTDFESGVTVGSVAPAAVVDKMSKKKKKAVAQNFYNFQRREAQRNEIMMLQSKFEQDKKRIQQLRAARKFRPY